MPAYAPSGACCERRTAVRRPSASGGMPGRPPGGGSSARPECKGAQGRCPPWVPVGWGLCRLDQTVAEPHAAQQWQRLEHHQRRRVATHPWSRSWHDHIDGYCHCSRRAGLGHADAAAGACADAAATSTAGPSTATNNTRTCCSPAQHRWVHLCSHSCKASCRHRTCPPWLSAAAAQPQQPQQLQQPQQPQQL